MNRFIHHKIYWLLLTITCFVYLLGMLIDVMQVDAAQYAGMSMEMIQNKSFLQVFNRGNDYLDKPPLLFWLSSLSIGAFGINNFAFKLPSVLSSLLAIYSIYRLARLYYSEKGALFAAIILATSEAFFIISNDIRTDNLLISFSIFAIWQLIEYLKRPRIGPVVWAGFGIGMAMLAKGPLGLIFPLMAVGPQLLYAKQWKSILNFKWVFAIPVILILLTPMCIGLYSQFGTKGLYFFFWEQSFGRITGENVWKNDTDPFFLVHTFLYAILPWTILFIVAFFKQITSLFQNRFKINPKQPEILGFSGYLLATLALSQSEYQLPHYIYIATPLAALMTAGYIDGLSRVTLNKWRTVQHIFNVLFTLFILLVITFVWELSSADLILILILGIATVYFYIKVNSYSFVWGTAVVGMFVNMLLFVWFYPNLLEYQSTGLAGKEINKRGVQNQSYYYGDFGFAMDFYAGKIIPALGNFSIVDATLNVHEEIYLYTTPERIEDFKNEAYRYEIIKQYDFFRPARLTFEFLNPKTRAETLKKKYLIRVSKYPK